MFLETKVWLSLPKAKHVRLDHRKFCSRWNRHMSMLRLFDLGNHSFKSAELNVVVLHSDKIDHICILTDLNTSQCIPRWRKVWGISALIRDRHHMGGIIVGQLAAARTLIVSNANLAGAAIKELRLEKCIMSHPLLYEWRAHSSLPVRFLSSCQVYKLAAQISSLKYSTQVIPQCYIFLVHIKLQFLVELQKL